MIRPSTTRFSAPVSSPPALAWTSASSFATVASSCSAMKLFTDHAMTPNNSNPEAPKIAAYRMVSRKLEVRSDLGRRTDAIPAAAHGVNQFRPPAIDLPPPPADVAFHKTGARIEVEAPDMFQQHRSRHYLIRVPHQVFQQLVFTRLQFHLLAAAPDDAGQQVHFQIGDPQHDVRSDPERPPAKRTYPRDQFGKGERFDQVIVAPRVQAAHPVVQPAHGGQEKCWRTDTAGAQGSHQSQPVQPGQHAINDQQVPGFRSGTHQRRAALHSDFQLMPFAL